jgi:hypothetical protein
MYAREGPQANAFVPDGMPEARAIRRMTPPSVGRHAGGFDLRAGRWTGSAWDPP